MPSRIPESGQKLLLSQRQRTVEGVMSQITVCIKELSAAGYHETAAMLAIARMDLLVRQNGITDDELQYMLAAAGHQTAPSD